MSAQPDLWVVTSGWRSSADQAALYARGRTTPGPIVTFAQPGHSAHEHGFAVDVARVVAGALSWDVSNPAWHALWSAIRAAPGLHAGHDFALDTNGRVQADDDHIEAYRWCHSVGGAPSVYATLEASGQWTSV